MYVITQHLASVTICRILCVYCGGEKNFFRRQDFFSSVVDFRFRFHRDFSELSSRISDGNMPLAFNEEHRSSCCFFFTSIHLHGLSVSSSSEVWWFKNFFPVHRRNFLWWMRLCYFSRQLMFIATRMRERCIPKSVLHITELYIFFTCLKEHFEIFYPHDGQIPSYQGLSYKFQDPFFLLFKKR